MTDKRPVPTANSLDWIRFRWKLTLYCRAAAYAEYEYEYSCTSTVERQISPSFLSTVPNFSIVLRTITLVYYHHKLWGPPGIYGIYYYRAGLPFVDTIAHDRRTCTRVCAGGGGGDHMQCH
jgi:hypothetical protein